MSFYTNELATPIGLLMGVFPNLSRCCGRQEDGRAYRAEDDNLAMVPYVGETIASSMPSVSFLQLADAALTSAVSGNFKVRATCLSKTYTQCKFEFSPDSEEAGLKKITVNLVFPRFPQPRCIIYINHQVATPDQYMRCLFSGSEPGEPSLNQFQKVFTREHKTIRMNPTRRWKITSEKGLARIARNKLKTFEHVKGIFEPAMTDLASETLRIGLYSAAKAINLKEVQLSTQPIFDCLAKALPGCHSEGIPAFLYQMMMLKIEAPIKCLLVLTEAIPILHESVLAHIASFLDLQARNAMSSVNRTTRAADPFFALSLIKKAQEVDVKLDGAGAGAGSA